jgi:hypothetical protein
MALTIRLVKATPVKSIEVAMMTQVNSGLKNLDTPVAVKVIDLKMLKSEINRTLLAS